MLQKRTLVSSWRAVFQGLGNCQGFAKAHRQQNSSQCLLELCLADRSAGGQLGTSGMFLQTLVPFPRQKARRVPSPAIFIHPWPHSTTPPAMVPRHHLAGAGACSTLKSHVRTSSPAPAPRSHVGTSWRLDTINVAHNVDCSVRETTTTLIASRLYPAVLASSLEQ